jgi:DNA-directed RNA polymerase specialized sigma24 family protein
MEQDELRLSRIETVWSVVRRAHDGSTRAVQSAQESLLDRYGGAIRRYLLGALRSEDAADEVFQEFSLNLVRGAFHRADPSHGRFRNFVKTAVFHLIVDYQRRGRRRGLERPFAPDAPEAAADACPPEEMGSLADQEAAFSRSWREDLLARCWTGLAEVEQSTGTPYYTILRFRLDHPDMRSPEIASQLAARLGKPVSATSVRVMIHRAREMFANLLLDAVLGSLDSPCLDEAEEELIELNLLEYCRDALRQRQAEGPAR